MRVYLDSNVIIYLFEGSDAVQRMVQERIAALEADGSPQWMTSRLSRLECRVRPLRERDEPLLRQYDAFFSRPELAVSELDVPTLELATAFRAAQGFKTPDALHLASASLGRADLILTGDKALARFTDVAVELVG